MRESEIRDCFGLPDGDLAGYSPLTLAFIGDSIYALIAKTVIVERTNCPANVLHKETVKYVSAVAQANITRYLMENNMLTERESAILRRGRNAKASSVAKNASVGDYRLATGLEALAGYLYLDGKTERLLELLKAGFEYIDSCNEEK